VARSNLAGFIDYVRRHNGEAAREVNDYASLYRWSVGVPRAAGARQMKLAHTLAARHDARGIDDGRFAA